MLSPRMLRVIAGLLVLLWLSALLFPSIGTCRDGGGVTWFSTETTVFFGWMAAFAGMLGWYANATWVVCLTKMAKGERPSPTVALIGLALAATSFMDVELAHNEAWTEPVCAWGVGFWLWFSGQAILPVLALSQALAARRAKAAG